MSKKRSKKGLNRRDFIKRAAAGAGVAALMGLDTRKARAIPISKIPGKWDYEADVAVLGTGAAGFAAAITAHDKGAKVLILEKASEPESGGNSRVSGQGFWAVADIQGAILYHKELAEGSGYPVPEDMIQAFMEECSRNIEWIERIGGKISSRKYKKESPFLGVRVTNFPYPSLWNLLKTKAIERKIEVMYETPGKELIQNPETKEILGVIAERVGKTVYIKAKRAVAMCPGGYENNKDMQRDYLRLPEAYPMGSPHNTGDGVKMCQKIGADLWHMQSYVGPGSVCCGLKAPEFKSAVKGYEDPKPIPIYVGKDGKRFIDESIYFDHGIYKIHGVYELCPVPVPIHMIFDEKRRLAGPVCDVSPGECWVGVIDGYTWSRDNLAELKKGWIIKANTIRELAIAIGKDANVLEETINKYNEYYAAGKDLEYGRPAETMMPIGVPPFYAIEMKPVILNTQGGPRRNKKAQILDPDGNSIPRLYSAGELGSIYSFRYQGGGNLSECLSFGRIAGANAAAEKPWE